MVDLYADGSKLALAKDVANENLAYGNPYDLNSASILNGNTKSVSFSANNGTSDNWHYIHFNLASSFKKGDVITISVIGNLTGSQSADGYFKTTVFSSDLSTCFDDNQEGNPLKSGGLCSKTIVFNADGDPNNPPILLLYAGLAGTTGGNTLSLKNIKVERGSIATPWIPSSNDIVMQSDVASLQDQINQLKSKVGS